MRRIWTIASRELRALFDLPTGYVLLVVFLAINGFLFFRQAYLSNTASLRPMLDILPWEFLFFVPAVTMRSLAEDIRGGQIEVVLAQLPGVRGVDPRPAEGDRVRLTVTVAGTEDLRPRVFELAKASGWTLFELHQEAGSLEDLFRQLTTDQEPA